MSVNIENEETRKIINFIQKLLISIHERFDFFDSIIGRRTTITEIKVDKLEKDMNVLGKEIREQYYSIGRRIDLLQEQLNRIEKGKNN